MVGERLRRQRKENLEWGLRRGLSMAAIFGAYVVALSIARWSIWFPELETNLFAILLAYAVAGSSPGAVIGVLRPYNTSGWAGAFIGLVASAPVNLALGIATFGLPTQWGMGQWCTLGIMTVVIGPLLGVHLATRDRTS